MLSLNEQLEIGSLVCPRTFAALQLKNGYLETVDGSNRYAFVGSAPVLFANLSVQQAYLQENSGHMNTEYSQKKTNSIIDSVKKIISKDYRSREATNAFNNIFENLSPHAICLAIGGGPRRHHPELINLNIGAFENVDIVADAYNLPYADESINAIYIEAVLEHLEFPEKAVKEIFRVLKKGGAVYADTPFMQDFHGYPNHFQNFTIEGHSRLFARNGFKIKESGTSVGPTYALFAFITHYIKRYFYPAILKYPFLCLAYLIALLFKPVDLLLNSKNSSHFLASTTFVYAIKL
jgi:SAM-dependent methyltransferase